MLQPSRDFPLEASKGEQHSRRGSQQAWQLTQFIAPGQRMVLDKINRVGQSHHFFHVGLVATKSGQQQQALVPVVDIVENATVN